jgi:hypothetical protein
VRATYLLVPHDDLLLLSDWPVSPIRPLRPDHVLGPNPSASLLANVTVGSRVDSVLDLGAGCGIQSLLAARPLPTAWRWRRGLARPSIDDTHDGSRLLLVHSS